MKIDTSGDGRLPAASNTTLDAIFAAIDGYLKNGHFEYADWDELSSAPSDPATDRHRLYRLGDVWYSRDDAGQAIPLGSGAGGGAGASWYEPSGSAPIKDEEHDREVYLFQSGLSQKLILSVKVPEGFITGRQVKAYLTHYSPSASNTQLLKAKTTLIRENLDAVDSDSNQHTSTNTAITNTVAKQMRKVEVDLTDSNGQINGFDVDPGDLIEIELYRDTDTDTADIRFIPSATEVKFG
jgi:hypothetical protein